jgi:alkaline phosphatase
MSISAWTNRRALLRLGRAIVAAVLLTGSVAFAAGPKNVILFIGDGMGPEQVKAAGMYANGAAGTLNFESFAGLATATTYSANAAVTDSAASGTAIATGHKVNNGVVSVALPGDGSDLPILLEYFKELNRSTGLVTTTEVTHATPASFGAHVSDRNDRTGIGQDYLDQTRPNVLFGGADGGLSTADVIADGGYPVV